MVMGGRDPYKNDLVRWMAGLPQQERFRTRSFEKHHSFTTVYASQYPDDWRSARLSMRMGSVDQKLREALATNTAELTQQFAAAMHRAQDEDADGAAAREGVLTMEQFVSTLETVKLLGPRGEHIVVPSQKFEDLFMAADIDGDGTVSLSEFMAAFKPADGEGAGDRNATGVKRNLANADQVDLENHDQVCRPSLPPSLPV